MVAIFHQGMVLVSKDLASACMEFEADIFVLYHDTKVCTGFQTTIYVGNVCQTVQVMKIHNKVGRRGVVFLVISIQGTC